LTISRKFSKYRISSVDILDILDILDMPQNPQIPNVTTNVFTFQTVHLHQQVLEVWWYYCKSGIIFIWTTVHSSVVYINSRFTNSSSSRRNARCAMSALRGGGRGGGSVTHTIGQSVPTYVSFERSHHYFLYIGSGESQRTIFKRYAYLGQITR
jgi:hypothetical protein